MSKREFPQISSNGSEESQEVIRDWLNSFATSFEKPKKRTPKKKEESVEGLWIEPSKYLEFVDSQKDKENPKVMCPWICKKGSDKTKIGKACGVIIDDGTFIENSYAVRCRSCKRNNTEGSTKRLKQHYEGLRDGNEVTGSPTAYNSSNDEEAATTAKNLTGLAANVTSPTGPKEFLDGNSAGIESPSKAKKKSSSPKGVSIGEDSIIIVFFPNSLILKPKLFK